MTAPRSLSRRRVLASQCSILALALAGCAEGGTDARPGTANRDTTADRPTAESETAESTSVASGAGETASTATADGTGTADLDLREANVVGVSVEERNGAYAFDVTLHHDDDGEDGYANWWQVERLDGTLLGRRDLLHAHSQQPFTRSQTIEIPEGVTCVVVRGHDETHAYGGVATIADLESGETRTIDQGPEKQSFDAGDCP